MSGTGVQRVLSKELVFPASMNFVAPIIVGDLIRVGSANDGGYVIPERLIHEIDFLVSMGVEENWAFEEQFMKLNPSLRIHAYDYSISRRIFRKRVLVGAIGACLGKWSFAEVRRRVRVLKSYGAFFRGTTRHFQERIFNPANWPIDVTLAQVFERIDSDRVFLKIDIEGSEYRIVDEIAQFAHRISGMAIEFHDTGPLRPVFSAAIRRIQESFAIVHLHGNNYAGISADGVPEALEVTFLKKTLCRELQLHDSEERRTRLPLASTDAPSDPRRSDYEIRFCL